MTHGQIHIHLAPCFQCLCLLWQASPRNHFRMHNILSYAQSPSLIGFTEDQWSQKTNCPERNRKYRLIHAPICPFEFRNTADVSSSTWCIKMMHGWCTLQTIIASFTIFHPHTRSSLLSTASALLLGASILYETDTSEKEQPGPKAPSCTLWRKTNICSLEQPAF